MSLGKTEMKRGTLTNQNESSSRSRSCNIDSLLEDDGQGGQNMKPSHPSRWLLSHATASSLAKPTLPSTRVNLTSGTSSIFYPDMAPSPDQRRKKVATLPRPSVRRRSTAGAASYASTMSTDRVDSPAKNRCVPICMF